MAVTPDHQTVLDYLVDRRNITRGSIAEKFYSSTCIEYEPFQVSRSLESYEATLKERNSQSASETSSTFASSSTPVKSPEEKKTKVIDFKKSKGGSGNYKFVLEKVSSGYAGSGPGQSGLAAGRRGGGSGIRAMESRKNPKLSQLTALIQAEPKPPALRVTVHLPQSHGKPMIIEVPKTATVLDLIKMTLKTHKDECRFPPLPGFPEAYQLRMAEDDGSPAEEMPSLRGTALLDKFGKVFALCKNTAKGLDPMDVATLSRELTETMFVVILPDNQKTTVHFQPALRLSTVLEKVLGRRGLDPQNFSLVLKNDMAVNSNHTLLELKEMGFNEVILKAKFPEAYRRSTDVAFERRGTVRESTTSDFRSYNVTFKKSGMSGNESRILGVGKSKLSFSRKSKFASSRKIPSKEYTDVYKVTLLDKPKQFNVEYKDGRSEVYEAESMSDAYDIVNRINEAIQAASR